MDEQQVKALLDEIENLEGHLHILTLIYDKYHGGLEVLQDELRLLTYQGPEHLRKDENLVVLSSFLRALRDPATTLEQAKQFMEEHKARIHP